MKDRWKIVIISIILACLITLVFSLIGSCFRKVSLRSYGLLKNVYYSIVDDTQLVRTNGNYFVGIDWVFHEFPRGVINKEFLLQTLTKDKTLVEVQVLFAGRLLQVQVKAMYEDYGDDYEDFLAGSVQEFTRQAIQQYSLHQVIENRRQVDQSVNSFVCASVEAKYAWVQCDMVSLGSIGGNIPRLPTLSVDTTVEQRMVETLHEYIHTQQISNLYNAGLLQLTKQLQQTQGQLFYNVSKLLTTNLNNITNTQTKSSALNYFINSPLYSPIELEVKLSI